MNLYLARDRSTNLTTGTGVRIALVSAMSIVDAAAIIRREIAASNLSFGLAFTGASWTEATNTLTKTSGFTLLDFSEGDNVFVSITGGTNADKGLYTVSSRTSNDAIVLGKTLQNSGGAASSIAGYAFRVMELSDSDNEISVLTGGKATFDPYGVGLKFMLTASAE